MAETISQRQDRLYKEAQLKASGTEQKDINKAIFQAGVSEDKTVKYTSPVETNYKQEDLNRSPVDVISAELSKGDPILANWLESDGFVYPTDEVNPILYKQQLSERLKTACSSATIQTPASCYKALNESMWSDTPDLKVSPSATRSIDVFLEGRSADEVKALQEKLGFKGEDIDGLAGKKTRIALANYSSTFGFTSLSNEFKRTDLSTIANTMFDVFTGKGVASAREGKIPHEAKDNNITLMGGVVPNGLTYNGKPVTQGSWKDLGSNFKPNLVNTTGAWKTVNGVKIKRSSFKTDEQFTKYVLESFSYVAAQKMDEAGLKWDNPAVTTEIKKTILSAGWNMGEGWFSNEDTKNAYAEFTKESPNQTKLHKAFLSAVTFVNGGAATSLARRRAEEWNAIAGEVGGTKIERVTADNSGTNTVMQYYDSNDNLLFKKQTDRASSKFENENVTQRLNSKGTWYEVPNSEAPLSAVPRPKPRPVGLAT